MSLERIITSHAFGNLGVFNKVGPRLYAASSNKCFVAGNGQLGGKGEGCLFIDRHADGKHHYAPKTLVVSNDWFGIAPQSLINPNPVELLPQKAMEELFTILSKGFPFPLAIRSSALIEDRPESLAAGKFKTEMHGLPLSTPASRGSFTQKIKNVLNSAYSTDNVRYWERMGYTEIPPMAVVIQEIIGSEWKYCPGIFFPLVAGVANSSFNSRVEVKICAGLGHAAVSHDLGAFYRHRISREHRVVWDPEKKIAVSGDTNHGTVFAIDLTTGDLLTRALPAKWFLDEPSTACPAGLKGKYGFITSKMLAYTALFLEEKAGSRLDMEFAFSFFHNDPARPSYIPYLLQARPVPPRVPYPMPELKSPPLFSLSSCIGSGGKVFEHVTYVWVKLSHFDNLAQLINIVKNYPHNLVILSITMLPETGVSKPIEKLLEVTDCVLVVDRGGGAHVLSGISHLGLTILGENKMVLYSKSDPGAEFDRELQDWHDFTLIKEQFNTDTLTLIQVFRPPHPIHVACDDDNNQGMVWVEE